MSEETTTHPVPDPAAPVPATDVAAEPVNNPPYVPPPGPTDTPPPVPKDDPNMDQATKDWLDAHRKPPDPRDPPESELTHGDQHPPSPSAAPEASEPGAEDPF